MPKNRNSGGIREIYGYTGEVLRVHLPPRAEQIIHVGHDTLSASNTAIHNPPSPPMRFGCAQNGGSCARASTKLVPCVVLCVYARACASMCMTSASHTARAVPVPTAGTEHVPRPSTPTRAHRALHHRRRYSSAKRRIANQCESKRGRERAEGASRGSHSIGLAASETAHCHL